MSQPFVQLPQVSGAANREWLPAAHAKLVELDDDAAVDDVVVEPLDRCHRWRILDIGGDIRAKLGMPVQRVRFKAKTRRQIEPRPQIEDRRAGKPARCRTDAIRIIAGAGAKDGIRIAHRAPLRNPDAGC